MAGSGELKDVNIIDIRRGKLEDTLVQDLVQNLDPGVGVEKTLPTLLLYDEAGLKLFEKITYLDEYYLTNSEIEVLTTHADQISRRIPPGTRLVELGSGNLRKVNILLQAFERAGKDIEYYALDLSLSELERTLTAIPVGTYKHVKCFGLHGTYDDGLAWLVNTENQAKTKCILSLGSSIGNFNRDEAEEFLAEFGQTLGPSDSILIGLDACQDEGRVFPAYNDREGVTRDFYRNALTNANTLLGKEAFKQDEWDVVGVYNKKSNCHQAFFSPLKDVTIEGIQLRKGERFRLEESYKYSRIQSETLWHRAGLNPVAIFSNAANNYHIHMMSSPKFSWSLKPEEYASNPVPSLQDWEGLWKAWDTVSRGMVPQEELLSKPIKLRNACIFYLGHIPTFSDIHLTRSTGAPATEPTYYWSIFERGIDPDVENPELCHAHSEIPETWPPLDEILDYQDRVRSRVRMLIKSGQVAENQKLAKAMWIGFEHEAMHLETFLYMLLQSDNTLAPTGIETPDFAGLAAKARQQSTANEWITIPERPITIGMDDSETNSGPDRHFGWDNEKPVRTTTVKSFSAQARPITNGEYAKYLEANQIEKIPTSWSQADVHHNKTSNGTLQNGHANGSINGHAKSTYTEHMNGAANGHTEETASSGINHSFLTGKIVRTVFGPVSLTLALDWPVIASFDELVGFAKWMDSRIPTADEVRSIYSFVNQIKSIDPENVIGKTISAVNGHLVNEGVEETPPSRLGLHDSPSGDLPKLRDFFVDLEGCNIGFKNWHPVPVTANGKTLAGRGDMGGVWEWTSSPLEEYEGFKAMESYPGYTADFFDGKHNIVLGGSWATHPRIAGRKSFVNWFQRNYLYALCGARLVRDL